VDYSQRGFSISFFIRVENNMRALLREIALAALEMAREIAKLKREKEKTGEHFWDVRIGETVLSVRVPQAHRYEVQRQTADVFPGRPEGAICGKRRGRKRRA
jgi:hypothetical protein